MNLFIRIVHILIVMGKKIVMCKRAILLSKRRNKWKAEETLGVHVN